MIAPFASPLDEIDHVQAAHSVVAVASRWVTLRESYRPGWHVGPCPLCSKNASSRSSRRFECDATRWICSACGDGGDVLRLVMAHEGLEGADALDWLHTLEQQPMLATVARAAGREAHEAGHPRGDIPLLYAPLEADWLAGWDKAEQHARVEQRYRDWERRRLNGFWQAAHPLPGSPGAVYLQRRGLVTPDFECATGQQPSRAGAKIRFHPDMPYESGRTRYSGPALLAATVRNDGRFAGLNCIWIDLDAPPGFRASIFVDAPLDAATGQQASRGCDAEGRCSEPSAKEKTEGRCSEPSAREETEGRCSEPSAIKKLPAQKTMGSVEACHGELVACAEPSRLLLGVRLESCLALHASLLRAGRAVAGTAVWSSLTPQNLGGPAAFDLPHPVKPGKRVPAEKPHAYLPAIAIPASVRELVLVGSGDADPVAMTLSLDRAASRYRAPGRRILIVNAPEGSDFGDLVLPGSPDVSGAAKSANMHASIGVGLPGRGLGAPILAPTPETSGLGI